MAAFSHPNVCAIFDVGRLRPEGASASQGRLRDEGAAASQGHLRDEGAEAGQGEEVSFLVMEYLDGETLAARLERGSARASSGSRIATHATATPSGTPTPTGGSGGHTAEVASGSHALPVAETIRIATALAEALAAAHKAGIVHRDLKPGNVILTRSGVKVLDFGLARMVGRDATSGAAAATMIAAPLTGTGMLLGTVPYMSPEQVEGKEVDARSDIFALGSVIYEMATGRRAFDGASQASLIAAILERQPAPISDVQPLAPAGLDRIVRTCLEKDPDDRWQHASDIARQLKWLAVEGEPKRDAAGPAVSVNGTTANTPPIDVRPRRMIGWPHAIIAVAGLAFGAYVATQPFSRRSAAEQERPSDGRGSPVFERARRDAEQCVGVARRPIAGSGGTLRRCAGESVGQTARSAPGPADHRPGLHQ